jgi:hypothetical protein
MSSVCETRVLPSVRSMWFTPSLAPLR